MPTGLELDNHRFNQEIAKALMSIANELPKVTAQLERIADYFDDLLLIKSKEV